MKIDYATHYNDDYWRGKKQYHQGGQTHFYHGPSLYWDGFELIANTLGPLIPGKSLLDIGCSGGDLASRLHKGFGHDPYGIDISEYAVKNCVPHMQGRIALADITTCPELVSPEGNKFPEKFDVVMATDLLEHIYEEDLDKTFDWMVSKTNRWMFFLVATAQNPGTPFYVPDKHQVCLKKGQVVPPELEATAIAGHVNVRSFKYWVKFFQKKGLTVRWDLGYLFQMAREMDEPWKKTGGWNMHCTWFLEKK